MKKLFLVLLFPILISSSVIDPEKYDEGYKDGYCEAYRDCLAGAYAKCAIPPYIDNQPYLNGLKEYKDGFKAGLKHGQKSFCK